MAYPVIESAVHFTTGTSQLSGLEVTAPSAYNAGDLLLIIAMNENLDTNDWSAITGWEHVNIGDNANDAQLSFFYRKATADSNDGFPLTLQLSGGDFQQAWRLVISGVDQTTPVNVIGTAALLTSTDPKVAPELTTLVPDQLVIYGFAHDGDDVGPTTMSGTGWTEGDQSGNDPGNGSGLYASWGYKFLASAGLSGDVTQTCTVNDGAGAMQIAIKPASGTSAISGTASGTSTVTGTLTGRGVLSGTASGTSTVTGVLQDIGLRRYAGNFEGTGKQYLSLGNVVGFEVNLWELELDIEFLAAPTVYERIININPWATGDGAAEEGIRLARNSGRAIRLEMGSLGSVSNKADSLSSLTIAEDGRHIIRGKFDTQYGYLTVLVDEVEGSYSIHNIAVSDPSYGSGPTTLNYFPASPGWATCIIHAFRFWELNTSGERIQELIKLEPANISNGLTWPNTAVDAPASSDGTWDLGTASAPSQWVYSGSVFSGSAVGTSTVSGTLTGKGAIAGTAAGTSTVSGTLTGKGALSGTSSGTSTASGLFTGWGSLSGIAAGVAIVVGTIFGMGSLSGTASGAATVSGTIYNSALTFQSDNFNGGSLDSRWHTMENTAGATISVVDVSGVKKAKIALPAAIGYDSYGASIQSPFVYQDVSNGYEFDLRVKINPSPDGADTDASNSRHGSGLMFYADVDNWFGVEVMATDLGTTRLFYRGRDNGTTFGTYDDPVTITLPVSPVWVRLKNVAGTFTVYISDDDSTWEEVFSRAFTNLGSSSGNRLGFYGLQWNATAANNIASDHFYEEIYEIGDPLPTTSPISGTASGTSTVSGTLTGKGSLSGTASGVATVSGTLTGIGVIAGTSSGTATVSGSITGLGNIVGTANGIATVSGSITGKGALSGTASGTSTATGTIYAKGGLAGTASGVATVSGTLTGKGSLAGTSSGTSTVSGTLTGLGSIAGTSSGTSIVSGTLVGKGEITGTASGVVAVSGTLVGKGALSGTASGVATVSGTLQDAGHDYISGTAFGVATVTGTITGRGELSGTASGTSTVIGTLTSKASINGTASGTSTVIGTITGRGELSGTASGTSTVSGAITGKGALSGTASGVATVSGTIINAPHDYISGTASGVATVTGTLTGHGALSGTAAGTCTVVGSIYDTALPILPTYKNKLVFENNAEVLVFENKQPVLSFEDLAPKLNFGKSN